MFRPVGLGSNVTEPHFNIRPRPNDEMDDEVDETDDAVDKPAGDEIDAVDPDPPTDPVLVNILSSLFFELFFVFFFPDPPNLHPKDEDDDDFREVVADEEGDRGGCWRCMVTMDEVDRGVMVTEMIEKKKRSFLANAVVLFCLCVCVCVSRSSDS